MQITFLMKFTEIFLSSAELCYCDRNKEMKPSRVLSEKVMAPYSGTLAWKIPWTEEPGGLQSMGSRRVRHLLSDFTFTFTFMHWRRKWQPPPVFLPGESQGWRGLAGYRLWGRRVGHD